MNETRIDELRRAKGWTQEKLADESGIAVRTIQRVESGQDASLTTVTAIANALGVPVRDLFASLENESFQTAVDGLDDRRERQQSQRDGTRHGYDRLFHGIGILVVFGTIALVLTTRIGWFGWLIIPAYWGGGRYLYRFIIDSIVEPKLDEQYPLSHRTAPLRRDRHM